MKQKFNTSLPFEKGRVGGDVIMNKYAERQRMDVRNK